MQNLKSALRKALKKRDKDSSSRIEKIVNNLPEELLVELIKTHTPGQNPKEYNETRGFARKAIGKLKDQGSPFSVEELFDAGKGDLLVRLYKMAIEIVEPEARSSIWDLDSAILIDEDEDEDLDVQPIIQEIFAGCLNQIFASVALARSQR